MSNFGFSRWHDVPPEYYAEDPPEERDPEDEMLEMAHRNASDNAVLRAELRDLKSLLFRIVISNDLEALKSVRSMFEFAPIPLDQELPF